VDRNTALITNSGASSNSSERIVVITATGIEERMTADRRAAPLMPKSLPTRNAIVGAPAAIFLPRELQSTSMQTNGLSGISRTRTITGSAAIAWWLQRDRSMRIFIAICLTKSSYSLNAKCSELKTLGLSTCWTQGVAPKKTCKNTCTSPITRATMTFQVSVRVGWIPPLCRRCQFNKEFYSALSSI
jgi:hypothetical protein